MEADVCLGDNLILFRCFAKTSNYFQSKLATTNSNFEKNNYLDMHYCITYMYINFQQTLVISVQTVHTNIFAKNRKLYKFATTNSNFEKKNFFLDMHHKCTCISIFSKIGLIDQS